MPFEDFVVADADMHVMEPPDLWKRYIAPEYRHAAPVGLTELRRDIRIELKSQILLKVGPVSPLRESKGAGIGWRKPLVGSGRRELTRWRRRTRGPAASVVPER